MECSLYRGLDNDSINFLNYYVETMLVNTMVDDRFRLIVDLLRKDIENESR